LHRGIDGLETSPVQHEVRGGVIADRDHQIDEFGQGELEAGVEVAKDAAPGGAILVAQAGRIVKSEHPAVDLAVGLDHDRHLDGARRPETAIAVMGVELARGSVDRDPNHTPRGLGVMG
jgi:hypothetical protein